MRLQPMSQALHGLPPREVSSSALSGVPKPVACIYDLMVSIEHVHGSASPLRLPPKPLKEVVYRHFLIAAVQDVSHLHNHCRPAYPGIVFIGQAAQAQHPLRLVEVAVQIPDGHKPPHSGENEGGRGRLRVVMMRLLLPRGLIKGQPAGVYKGCKGVHKPGEPLFEAFTGAERHCLPRREPALKLCSACPNQQLTSASGGGEEAGA
mmetsp:Transcript_14555/g.40966  ORF Transcript_14555/g.40966 Transcript_14555/m.40966 type:complete len:206 (-) Transcript_14555:100-717(-)